MLKLTDKRTHQIVIQSRVHKEKAGYIPLTTELNCKEIEAKIRKLIGEEND